MGFRSLFWPQLFRPRRYSVYLRPFATATGVGAQTTADVTSVGAGDVQFYPLTGAGASILETATVAGAGDVYWPPITGTGASSLASSISAGFGDVVTVPIVGVGAQTTEDAINIGTATNLSPNLGTGAQTTADALSTGVGYIDLIPITGVGGTIADGVTSAGEGTVLSPLFGTGAQTTATATIAGAGTVGFGTLWTPADLTVPPQHWYDAQDAGSLTLVTDRVSVWASKGSALIDATQSTNSFRPIYVASSNINGKPALRFDGANSQLKTTFSDIGGLGEVLELLYCNGSLSSYGVTLTLSDASEPQFNTSALPVAMDTPSLIEAMWTGATIPLYQTGNLVDTAVPLANVARPGAIFCSAQLAGVGENNQGHLLNWNTLGNSPARQFTVNGDIGEYVYLDYFPSVDERERLEGYFAWRWNYVDQLRSDHPYKTEPPTVSVSGVAGAGAQTTDAAFNVGAGAIGTFVEGSGASTLANATNAGAGSATSTPGTLSDLPTPPYYWWDAKDNATLTNASGAASDFASKGSDTMVATQGSTSQRPAIVASSLINGTQALRFDANNDRLPTTFNDVAVVGSTMSIFFYNSLTTFGVGLVLQDASKLEVSSNTLPVDMSTAPCFVYAEWSGTTLSFYQNGVFINSVTLGSPAVRAGAVAVMTQLSGLGENGQGQWFGFNGLGNSPAASRTVNGDVGEWQYFDYVPSQAEREYIEGYTMWASGAEASLDSGHPYANAAPTLADVPGGSGGPVTGVGAQTTANATSSGSGTNGTGTSWDFLVTSTTALDSQISSARANNPNRDWVIALDPSGTWTGDLSVTGEVFNGSINGNTPGHNPSEVASMSGGSVKLISSTGSPVNLLGKWDFIGCSGFWFTNDLLFTRTLSEDVFNYEPEANQALSGITKGSTTVLTVPSGHGAVVGSLQNVTTSDIPELQAANPHTVTAVTATTVTLATNSSGFSGSWTSGGTMKGAANTNPASGAAGKTLQTRVTGSFPYHGKFLFQCNFDAQAGNSDPRRWGTQLAVDHAQEAVIEDVSFNGAYIANLINSCNRVTRRRCDVQNQNLDGFSTRGQKLGELGPWATALGASITAISNGNPCQITMSASHGLETGDFVWLEGTGVTQLDSTAGTGHAITVVNSTTFTLDGIDASAYDAWSSGGTVRGPVQLLLESYENSIFKAHVSIHWNAAHRDGHQYGDAAQSCNVTRNIWNDYVYLIQPSGQGIYQDDSPAGSYIEGVVSGCILAGHAPNSYTQWRSRDGKTQVLYNTLLHASTQDDASPLSPAQLRISSGTNTLLTGNIYGSLNVNSGTVNETSGVAIAHGTQDTGSNNSYPEAFQGSFSWDASWGYQYTIDESSVANFRASLEAVFAVKGAGPAAGLGYEFA